MTFRQSKLCWLTFDLHVHSTFKEVHIYKFLTLVTSVLKQPKSTKIQIIEINSWTLESHRNNSSFILQNLFLSYTRTFCKDQKPTLQNAEMIILPISHHDHPVNSICNNFKHHCTYHYHFKLLCLNNKVVSCMYYYQCCCKNLH